MRITTVSCVIGLTALLASNGAAQYSGPTGSTASGTTGAAGTAASLNRNYHIGFERPEAWGLKYFTSSTMLSGLPVPVPTEGRRVGSVTLSFEIGWIPQLDEGQQRIGFNGKAPEDLNKAPIIARPIVRIGLPGKLTALVAAPPPFEMFGVHPHLLEFGLERPLIERRSWMLGWRGSGQIGSVRGAFTCPTDSAEYSPGSAENPTRCAGTSSDVATLRYAGMELQYSHTLPGMPKLIPHVAAGGNFIDAAFQVHAPLTNGMDNTRMWTRGGTFTGTFGASYLVTSKAVFTVDGFYTPLWVVRSVGAPRTNDGLFNVRALLSYTFR